MHAYDLRIDSGGDEFVVSGTTPRLSWKNPAELGAVRRHELEAEVDGVSRPPATSDAGHLHVAWPWEDLRSGQRVRWRVRALSERPADWSPWHAFEAGLQDADWRADWISPVEGEDPGYGARGAHELSTTFELSAPVRRARLYATALGVYEAFVNDERAGTAELSPGSSSYDRTLYAQATDPTAALRPGTNRIRIVISDGWYRGQVGAFRIPSAWGTTVAARAELHLELEDGTRQVVRTDGTWVSAGSAITRADLMDGQSVELGLRPADPVPVRVGRVDAPPISWSPAPPVRVVETRAAASARPVAEGVWVVDFGQNASGWIRMRDLGDAGTRTTIDYGEHVGPDGDLSLSHLDSSRPGEPVRAFRQRDEVVSAGGDEVFEPHHTVHGFQYVRIAREGGFDPASVEMRIVHTDLRRASTFACSDDDLMRLHGIADWSFRGNAVDVPTDCPTRERLAWTGDYQVFVPTATRLYDVSGFTRKWLQAVRDDQLDDGRIANFSPDGRRIKQNLGDQFAMMTGSSGWGDAITIVPWEIYETYGDERVLSENWDAMRRWVEWALENARTARHHARTGEPEPYEQYLWDGSFHWGEWTEPRRRDADGNPIDPVKDNPMAWFSADKGEVGTAYLYRSTSILARTARVLGRDDDAARYAEVADRVRDAWRAAYLRSDGSTVGDTQAAYVRALNFALVPDELRDAAAARLVELVREAGGHLGTGFLATADLLPVLVDCGYADVAYDLLFQRTEPSWLYMIDRGATTIWEDWEGIDADGVAHESLNHYSKGAVIRFLHTHLLGLRQAPGSVAWESILVQPVPHPSLTWARGTYDSPQGTISVAWRMAAGVFELDLDVPGGTRARVVLPDGSATEVGPGRSTLRA